MTMISPKLYRQWRSVAADVATARRALILAETEQWKVENEMTRTCLPEDARIGEKVLIPHGRELIQIERTGGTSDCPAGRVTVRSGCAGLLLVVLLGLLAGMAQAQLPMPWPASGDPRCPNCAVGGSAEPACVQQAKEQGRTCILVSDFSCYFSSRPNRNSRWAGRGAGIVKINPQAASNWQGVPNETACDTRPRCSNC